MGPIIEYHLANHILYIVLLSVIYLKDLHKRIKDRTMLFKQTVGACRTMMSMSIEIFYSGIVLLFQKKILMLLAR